MSFTPTLCAMLRDKLLCERYIRCLDSLIDLATRERKRTRNHAQLRQLADFYFKIFRETRCFFVDECKCDLLATFRGLRESGGLEIIASAATHGFLPLLQEPATAEGGDLGALAFASSTASRSAHAATAARARVLIGRDVYVDLFGVEPDGFWCPNALMFRVWNPFYKRQIFAGSFSTRTGCCLENRVRAARFMRLVTRRPGRQCLRAIVIQADRSGAHREVIRVTPRTASFIATPDSTFHWNIWDQLLTAPGNSPV